MDPILKIYEIDNGFLLEVPPTAADGAAKVAYFKDEKGVADEIITIAARVKIKAVQSEMFTPAQMGANHVRKPK